MLVAVFVAAVLGLAQAGPKVETRHGPVEGQVVTLNSGKQVKSYMGIPFANPPVGDLRWKV